MPTYQCERDKKMSKEYEVFVKSIQEELIERREIELTIKDLTPGPRKYKNHVVKAILSSSPEKLPDSDILRVRSWTGRLYPEPWAIKIVKEVGEILTGRPHGETLERK